MMAQKPLRDVYGRSFQYLRLSLTDACNFQCVYCLPNGYQKNHNSNSLLNPDEIVNLITAFASLGVWKIRLTGGEPTLRRDLFGIVEKMNSVPGVRKITLTTNGYRLKHQARSLSDAGLSGINVSVDSLDSKRFEEITGRGGLKEVLEGIDVALKVGFREVKLNAVLLKGMNDSEFGQYLEYARSNPVTVRFIELMRTGHNEKLFNTHHHSTESLRQFLLERGWEIKAPEAAGGPAVELVHPMYRGKIGFISPYGRGFCESCNRLRVSAQGKLRLCLFGDGEVSLRRLLQSQQDQDELKELICTSLQIKPMGHRLHENIYGMTESLSSIGG
ncbi:MAG: GTP 3',8-cyclase MoaA [Bdellovibrionales bacterium]|nr:GTP 3',8-cyclase MoaA [Bdellovibrionales bacterium]